MTKAKQLIIANWKMNVSAKNACRLAEYAVDFYAKKKGRSFSLTLCPSFENISAITAQVRTAGVAIGAQDCFWEAQGPFTGEVSPRALKAAGCSAVLVGHSERRIYLGETDDMIAKKNAAAIAAGLVPIFCIGESHAQRKAGTHAAFLRRQLTAGTRYLNRYAPLRMVVAYEPLWAIGTGHPIAPSDCARIYRMLTKHVRRLLPRANSKVLYGGSVTADNIQSFVAHGVSDGALIGGASSTIHEFKNILKQLPHQ